MRTRRVQVNLHMIPDWMMRQGGGHPIGKVVEVSPIGVEIVAESHKGRHFFFPWSNVTGVEYLDDAPTWTKSWTPASDEDDDLIIRSSGLLKDGDRT